jgi:ribonuclease D
VASSKSLMNYEYIDTSRGLQSAVDRLRNFPLLGVDTEAAGYHRYHDRISLVQVSSREENFLFDPLAIHDFSPLGELFQDERIEKIFHDADFDLRILDRDLRLQVRRLFDTQIAAAFIGERSLGLGALVEKLLGVSLPKAYQRADWAERPLTEGMKEYAATDTAYLPALRDLLLDRLMALGRLGWAEEEFARRESIRWSGIDDSSEAFLRIKGSRDLSPRGLAILREIHLWREDVGKERDQATFRVLSNQALLEMGLKAPTSLADLRAISGISAGLLDRRGREILAAIQRGLAVSDSDLPRFPPPRRWERDPEAEERSERLRQARAEIAENLNLDPGFLISRAVLDDVARRNPSSLEQLMESPEIRRWQVSAFGVELLQALRG